MHIFSYPIVSLRLRALICTCLLILVSAICRSQTAGFCGQAQVMENWFSLHPEDRTKFETFQRESRCDSPVSQEKDARVTLLAPTYTVPVVFHILHLGGAENISDAQIHDQMAIFNRTFQKINPDTIHVVPSFTNNIADIQFEFRLANIDPDGNCTNGIIRHYTPATNWKSNDFNAFAYTWPRNKYLNIYIVRSIDIAPAYSFLPGTSIPPSADVIVCEHSICGSIGTSNGLNAWALTHEAAHWFNVPHIWGFTNQPGVVCGDDGITDTPITKGFVACNLNNTSICNPPIIENIQNYMDYSPCKIMFTNGQKARMHACINGTVNGRNNLSTPANLMATGITSVAANCIPNVEIAAIPSATVCSGKPLVINSFTSNANPTTYLWSANNNVMISNPALANPNFTFNSPGTSTVICVASNSNGAASASLVVTVADGSPQVAYTYQESFETGSLPPNWQILNPGSPSVLWNTTGAAASHGGQSMFVNAENAPGGSEEILQTPSYDFLNNPGSSFTFRYAYALYSSAHKDIFKVQASRDCGGSWKDIYVPSVSSLASGSGETSTSLFIPQSQQWKSYAISQHPNFSGFQNQPNVIFRFYFREDSAGFGNRIYLDQINFDTPAGINEFTKSINLFLYPNPTQTDPVLAFTLSDRKSLRWRILSSSGSLVAEQSERSYPEGKHELRLGLPDGLSSGIYFVELELNGMKAVKKLMLD